jgi:hypothetical protein
MELTMLPTPTFKELLGFALEHWFENTDAPSQGFWADAAWRAYEEEFEHDKQITVVGGAILNVWDYLTWPFGLLTCKLFGHDYVDTSYGGPESGYMGCACKRCGWEMGQRMY